MSGSRRRFVAFSAFPENLRAQALVTALRARGFEVVAPRDRRWHPTAGVLLGIVPNCWFALRCRADVAIGFKPHPNVTLPLLICRMRGIATWIDVDDLDHTYRNGWPRALVRLVQRPFPRRATVVTYHNATLRGYLLHEMGCDADRVVRLRQGVDVAAFDAARVLRARRAPRHSRVVVYSAHLNRANDLRTILAAWRSVADRVPDATLLVVGGGPHLRRYRRMAHRYGLARSVVFTGAVDHERVPSLLALADAAVLYLPPAPFNEHRCSLKLREYLAAEMRVVCNDTGELERYAPFVYQCGSSVPSLAAQIVRVLDGYDDGRQVRGCRLVQSRLDWGRILDAALPDLAARLDLGPRLPLAEYPTGSSPVPAGVEA